MVTGWGSWRSSCRRRTGPEASLGGGGEPLLGGETLEGHFSFEGDSVPEKGSASRLPYLPWSHLEQWALGAPEGQ